jgi:hypothetical protein
MYLQTRSSRSSRHQKLQYSPSSHNLGLWLPSKRDNSEALSPRSTLGLRHFDPSHLIPPRQMQLQHLRGSTCRHCVACQSRILPRLSDAGVWSQYDGSAASSWLRPSPWAGPSSGGKGRPRGRSKLKKRFILTRLPSSRYLFKYLNSHIPTKGKGKKRLPCVWAELTMLL